MHKYFKVNKIYSPNSLFICIREQHPQNIIEQQSPKHEPSIPLFSLTFPRTQTVAIGNKHDTKAQQLDSPVFSTVL